MAGQAVCGFEEAETVLNSKPWVSKGVFSAIPAKRRLQLN